MQGDHVKHIILFFYILSFATGFSSLGLILFVYNKTKNKALGHGILTFISFTMLLLAHTLRVLFTSSELNFY